MLSRLDLRSTADPRRPALPMVPRARARSRITQQQPASTRQDLLVRGCQDIRTIAADALAGAWDSLPPVTQTQLTVLAERIRVDCALKPGHSREPDLSRGVNVTRRVVAVDRVGLYVPSPSGTTGAVSSLLWYGLSAQAAGVGSIVVAIDPGPTGPVHPWAMAACHLIGVTEVFAVGGADAIAMLAYGAGACAPVDLIAGRDDAASAEARSAVSSDVDTLSEAATSTFAIVADRWADPSLVAADIIDVAASLTSDDLILMSPGEGFMDDVDEELAVRFPPEGVDEGAEEPVRISLGTGVLVDDMEHALAVVNAWRPTDVAIHSAYAWSYATRVRHADNVYVGAHSPFALRGSGLMRPLVSTSSHGSLRREISPEAFTRGVRIVTCTRLGLESMSEECEEMARAHLEPRRSAAVRTRWESSIAHAGDPDGDAELRG